MTFLFRPAVLFVAGLAGLLAAVPVRTPELWRHLAFGRDLFHGRSPSVTWLFDLLVYLVDGLAGGRGVAVLKAGAVAAAGAVLARAAGGGRMAAVAIALAVLAFGPRLLSLYTLPLLLLAVLVERLRAGAPRWQLVVVTLVWANVDRWAWLGAAVAGLTLLGQMLDSRSAADARRLVVTVLLLTAASVLNPAVVAGQVGAFDLGDPGRLAARSPFSAGYREAVASNPAGLAYFPLLVLSAGSFLLTGWRWERFLPWAALAAASAAQARLVPLFAVVAGPVLAWNLIDWAAGRAARPRRVSYGLGILAAAGLLVAAWPGWLVGTPYESRRLAVDLPPAVEQSAAAVAALGRPGRTLHLTTDTLYGFAWFLPAESGQLADTGGEAVQSFQAGTGADRAVLFLTGPAPLSPAARQLAASDPRALVFLGGGAAVFSRSATGQPVDLDAVGFGPAPPLPPPPADDWTAPFVRRRTAWPADRGAAAVAGALADAAAPTAFGRHALEWEAIQAVALVGATGHADLGLRLTLVVPPSVTPGQPPPPLTAQVIGLVRQFAIGRDDVPTAAAYAAVRAARRATAADPTDAAAFHLLGEAYLRLANQTRERSWGVAALLELRRVQATAALERAVRLSPQRRDTHLLLARLYRDIGYLDLVVAHLRATGDPAADLDKELTDRQATLARAGAGARVLDRATTAVELGLGGEALRILLGADVAAFGAVGVNLELQLLERTGRSDEALAWATPDLAQPLGPEVFHRLRATAAAAVGDYPLADAELADLAGEAVPPSAWARAVGDRALREVPLADLLPQAVWRGLGENDFRSTVAQMVANEDRRAEVLAVRGLLAVEAGDPALARRLFTQAAATGRPAALGGQIARAGLEWVGDR